MRKITNLNYDWFFKEKRNEKDSEVGNFTGFIPVELPHTIKILPYNEFDVKEYQFVASYKRTINVHKETGKAYILRFLGIAQRSVIYLNGSELLENKCGYNEIEIDITDTLEEGTNEIYVMCDASEGYFPPFGNIVDYLGYGGIYRECYLEETDKVYIKNPFFYVTDLLTDKPLWHLRLNFSSESLESIHILVTDNKDIALNTEVKILSGEEKGGVLGHVSLWSPDDPHLYTVTIERIKDGIVKDNLSFKFGFREIVPKADGLYLNGKKYLIRGLDRHQAYPYVGYAVPKTLQRNDAHLLKDTLGLNAMRSSHYMCHPAFLDECDKIGLIVYEEFPGWQYIGDALWKEQAMKNLDSMIYRDRNHPSIFFFGVRINESPDDYEFNKKAYLRAKELDPTLIITGTRAHRKGLDFDDCYTYNNFDFDLTKKALHPKKEVTKKKNPYLITEYCGHMYPNKSYDNEERRVNASLFHRNILKKVSEEGDIIGSMGWVFADYNTHKCFGPNDMICYHGVMDMFRNPKISAYTYMALRKNEPFLECSSSLAPGDYNASVFKVPYIYTNCEKVEAYLGDSLLHTYYVTDDILTHIFPFDDFFGNRMVDEEGISVKTQKSLKKSLTYILTHGFSKPLSLALHCNILLALKYRSLIQNYYMSIGSSTYTFKGYIGDRLVVVKKLGYGSFDHLDLNLSDTALKIEDTYGMIELKVTVRDTLGNIPRYLPDVVTIEPSEGLIVVGPKSASLIGGHASFYLRNKREEESKERVKVSIERCDSLMIEIPIVKI